MTIAFWCVLIAGILPQLAGVYAKASKEYDNENPREYLASLEGKKSRANAAMANGYEGFPLFAAAVIIAHILGTEQALINQLAIAYIIIRCIYSWVYIIGWGTVRSLVWVAGLACIISLFVVSA
jgi:uncharacterized MAPEG superfamily protein